MTMTAIIPENTGSTGRNTTAFRHGARYYIVDRGYYVREYWRPVPVYPEPYYYPALAPGVHIIMPDIYIPWRR